MSCQCTPTPNTCGNPQSCDTNGCAGTFDSNGIATCKGNFVPCQCNPTSNTCGNPQSCDSNGCAGTFDSNGKATCKGKFTGCQCNATGNTCGTPQRCDLNDCNGSRGGDGVWRCTNKFAGCQCHGVPPLVWGYADSGPGSTGDRYTLDQWDNECGMMTTIQPCFSASRLT